MSLNDFLFVVSAPSLFLIVVVKIFKACRRLDDEMPPAFVETARRVFNSETNVSSVLTFFLAYFDKFFNSSDGRPPRFFPCAIFSLLTFTTIASFIATISLWAAPQLLWSIYEDFFNSSDDWLVPLTPLQNAWITLSVILSANIIGDYFSLWETRFILEKLRLVISTKRMILLWTTDILASLLIFGISLLLVPILLALGAGEFSRLKENWWAVLLFLVAVPLDPAIYLFAERGLSIVFSVSLYTSLSTTLWVGVSIIVVKLWAFLRLVRFFPIAREKPFGAVTMAALMVLAVVAIVAKLLWSTGNLIVP